MAGAKRGTWIGGTVFVAVVIAAGAWFVAIQPMESQAADLRSQTEQVTSQNDVLSAQTKKLASEFAKLPDYQKQLDQLRTQVPTTAQLSDFLRQLDQMATAHTVVVTNIAPGVAQAFTAVTPVAPATPQPTGTATATPTATPSATTGSLEGDPGGTKAAPSGVSVPAGFAAIPLQVTVVGSYDNTLAFLSDLQTATPRLFLVSALTGTTQQKQQASGGRPATEVGDQELAVDGYLYVLPDSLGAAAPAPTPTASAPALPGAVPGKNPLVPVAGK